MNSHKYTHPSHAPLFAILLALFTSLWIQPAHGQSSTTNAPAASDSSPGCAQLPPDLIAWWQAENSGTNSVDGNPMTSVVGASYAPGQVGQAFVFNGSSVATVQDGQLLCPSNITIEGWFNLAEPPPYGIESVLVSKNGVDAASGWILAIHSDLHPRFVLTRNADISTYLVSTNPIALNTWVHIAATYNGTNACIFVDGTPLGTANFPGGYTPTSGTMYIGGASWCESYGCSGYNFHLTGKVDELSIYSRALDPAEIQDIYDARGAGKCLPGTPPRITTQPINQTLAFGFNATYSVSASGSQPLFYQWFSYPTNILADQTNAMLVVSNAQFAQSGWYFVTISNVAGFITSTNAALIITDNVDCNWNGIPNSWEALYGLDPCASTNSTAHPPGDKLTYLEKYLYHLSPLTNDTDGDGISDYDEMFVYHSNPLSAYTSGDGIPDLWKVQHGMNPTVGDATNEVGSIGVTYLQIYQYNQDPTHTNQLDPRNPFFAPGTSIYEVLNNGQHTNRFYYDREDRLVGADYSRGISISYQYDGNGNLLRQTVLSRSSETNGLPVLWQFLNGLTNSPDANLYGDSDNDGWSNYQEWLAGSNPNDPNSVPNVLGSFARNIASLTLPFTPSNFVVGTGQLDNAAAQAIVVGGDGDPGTNTNFLIVVTPDAASWTTQRVDIGPFGITSVAVGQVANRSGPGIYVGLRQKGGNGRIVELMNMYGTWQTNLVANSTNEAAFVIGVREKDVLGSLGSTNSPDGTVVSFFSGTNGWNAIAFNNNTSHRGLGVLSDTGARMFRSLRLLDAGGIEAQVSVAGSVTNLAPNSITNLALSGVATQSSTINGLDASLAINDNLSDYTLALDSNPSWLLDLGRVSWLDSIEIYNRDSAPERLANYVVSVFGAGGTNTPPAFTQLYGKGPVRPDFQTIKLNGLAGQFVQIKVLPPFYEPGNGYLCLAEVRVLGVDAPSFLTIPEPPAQSSLLWRGSSLTAGNERFMTTNSYSVFSSFVDDKTGNNEIDSGDDFVIAEYLVSGTNASMLTLYRQPIASTRTAQSYGLASVKFLNQSNDVFFTGEPDGQVFAWTATGATNALQRQLFDSSYYGKAWHALIGVKTSSAGEGLAGLMVDPARPNTCNLIFWPPQTSLPQLPNIMETAPSVAVIPSSNPLGSNSMVTILLWDAEGNSSTPFLQYQILGSPTWQEVTPTSLDNRPYNGDTRVAALPNGVRHTLSWNALAYFGDNVVTNILLRARARDFMLMGDWSLATPFQINTASGMAGTTDPLFGRSEVLSDGRFELTVTGGVLGQSYVLLASTNLVNWVPITGYIFTNPAVSLIDPDATNFPWRFYQIGPVSLSSAMSLGINSGKPWDSNGFNLNLISFPMVKYRLEASTDLVNWATITNLMNTNTSSLFNDPAALHLQQRFYRVLCR